MTEKIPAYKWTNADNNKMTENKLTLEDCLLYPKAMIVKNATKYINIIAFIVYHPISDEMQYEITNCKLILRSIEQLTDEEKIYINDNLFYGLFKNTVSLNANAIWNSFDELLAVCEDKTALIDYLRGNNIMIEKPDWFASGKAVKG